MKDLMWRSPAGSFNGHRMCLPGFNRFANNPAIAGTDARIAAFREI
jgi:hypothetical protein